MVTYTRAGKRPRLLPDEQIVALYLGGLDSESVGMRAGCSGTVVLKLVREAGGTVRRPGCGSGKPLHLTPEEIARRYLAGESGQSLAKESGCVTSTIYAVLRRQNIPLRDRNPWTASQRAKVAREARAKRKDNPDGA